MIARLPPAWPVSASLAFLTLLTLVVTGPAPLVDADLAISEAFRGFGTGQPGLISVVRVVTDVMSTASFLAVGCTAAVLLAAGGQRRAAGLCVAVTVAVPVLWGLLHWSLYRPRPLNGFVVIDSNGFPSGHTANAAAAALTAVLLLWPHVRRAARVVLVVAAACFAVAVGLTRVVLLTHWPADVLGGWLLALAVVPTLAAAFGGRAVATDRAVASGPATSAGPAGTPEPGVRGSVIPDADRGSAPGRTHRAGREGTVSEGPAQRGRPGLIPQSGATRVRPPGSRRPSG